jgi:hypothetical protein
MANTENKVGTLRYPKAPNLLIAPVEYDKTHQDEVNNTMRLYFNQLDNYNQATSIPVSNTTANRPIENLLVGQIFFDTTLGIPIWWSGSAWKNASGTTV